MDLILSEAGLNELYWNTDKTADVVGKPPLNMTLRFIDDPIPLMGSWYAGYEHVDHTDPEEARRVRFSLVRGLIPVEGRIVPIKVTAELPSRLAMFIATKRREEPVAKVEISQHQPIS